MVIDLSIDRISLELQDAAGHEHRVQPIVARAVTLLGERLVVQGEQAPPTAPGWVQAISAAPIRLDLARTGDEDAASQVAAAMQAAIAPYLGGRTRVSGAPAAGLGRRAMQASPLQAGRENALSRHAVASDPGGEPWPR